MIAMLRAHHTALHRQQRRGGWRNLPIPPSYVPARPPRIGLSPQWDSWDFL